MDYEWLYERLEPYYCHNNGRPGTDPVVLNSFASKIFLIFIPKYDNTPVFAKRKQGFFDRLREVPRSWYLLLFGIR